MAGRYKGRRGSIGVLIPVLIVLCVIAGAVLFILGDSMIFTKEGVIFSSEEEPVELPQIDPEIIIEEEEKKEPEPVSPKAGLTAAVIIPQKAIADEGFVSAALARPGINTVIFEVKAEDGYLAFSEKSRLAAAAGVSASDEALKKAISEARAKGYSVSLLMSCFKDNEAARKSQSFAVSTQNKIIWLDGENVRWLNPYSEAAQSYLLDVIKTLSAYGADELILSNISFPAVGRTELVFYGEGLPSKEDTLSSFIGKAEEAAGDMMLSAVYENYKDGYREKSGEKIENYLGFDAVYVKNNAGKYTNAFSAVSSSLSEKACPIIGEGETTAEGDYARSLAFTPPPEEEKTQE